VIEILALKGDASDNVPGVKGIGDKTAAPLIQKYKTIENLYDNLNSLEKPAVVKKLNGNKDVAMLSKKLVTIDLNVPLDVTYDKLEYKTPDFKKLDNFFESLGFNSLREKWRMKGIMEGIEYEVSTAQNDEKDNVNEYVNFKTINDVEHDYIFVDTKSKFMDMLDYIKTKNLISFDLETGSLDVNNTDVVGIALAVEENKGYYIPVYDPIDEEAEEETEEEVQNLFANYGKQNAQPTKIKWQSDLPMKWVVEHLKPVLENQNIGKCGQNWKFDAAIFKKKRDKCIADCF
jgi:DNA polymerase-1